MLHGKAISPSRRNAINHGLLVKSRRSAELQFLEEDELWRRLGLTATEPRTLPATASHTHPQASEHCPDGDKSSIQLWIAKHAKRGRVDFFYLMPCNGHHLFWVALPKKELVLVDAVLVERVLCVVDRCLKGQFPDDYYKRCFYASFGVHSLLQAMGHKPEIVGGNFLAFVVSRDQRQATMQGYASDSGEHSHYWIELDGAIIDPGTYYLPIGSSFQASEMPALFWDMGCRMPKGLRYASQARYASPDVVHLEPHIIEKMVPFLAACHARMAQPLVKPKIGKWLAMSPSSIKQAAIKGDAWARAVMRYESMPAEPLPF